MTIDKQKTDDMFWNCVLKKNDAIHNHYDLDFLPKHFHSKDAKW